MIDDLIFLIEDCDTFSEEEKSLYIKKSVEKKLTETDRKTIAKKIKAQMLYDEKEIKKAEKIAFENDGMIQKLEVFGQKIIKKLSGAMERNDELRIKKIESLLDAAEKAELEDEKKEDQDIEKAINTLQKKVDKKKAKDIATKIKK